MSLPHYWLPTEIWRQIFQLATAEECHDIETEYFPFQSSQPRQSPSPVTAISLSRVSKQWQAIAAEFLFRRVWVRHGAQGLLRSLEGPMHSEGYGRYVRRLELPSKLVHHDATNPIRLLDIFACCPHLEILVKPDFNGRQDSRFWSNLIPVTQPQTNDVPLTSLTRLDWSSRGWAEHETLEATRSVLASLIFRSPNLRYLSESFQPGPIFKDIDRSAHAILFPSLTLYRAGYAGLSWAGIQRGDVPNLTHLTLEPGNLLRTSDPLTILNIVGSQLRVVELLQDPGNIIHLDLNFFVRQCPNLQVFTYHVGLPHLRPLDTLQHLELTTLNLQVNHLYRRYGGTRVFWKILGGEFAIFSAQVFPALKHITLYGDLDYVVRAPEFRSIRQPLLDRGCTLEYVHILNCPGMENGCISRVWDSGT